MSRRSWSVQNARNRFRELVDAAQRAPQTVTRDGRAVVVVLAVEEYERLDKLKNVKAPTFIDMLLAMPQGEVEFEWLEARRRNNVS